MDANGNITQSFVRSMLTPTNTVNTNLFNASDPSGLSKFAKIGIRLMGHDLYDGTANGDVVLRTLLAPAKSGNTPFTTSAETIDMVKQWGKMDLDDDGKINGSVYGKLVEDVWPVTDGVNIAGFAKGLNYKDANLNATELFRATPNVETPEGLTQFVQQSGVTDTELLNFSLWGHRILDKANTTQQIAQSALNDPTSIDFGLTHFNSNTINFAQGLVNNPNAKTTVGLGVLNLMTKLSNRA